MPAHVNVTDVAWWRFRRSALAMAAAPLSCGGSVLDHADESPGARRADAGTETTAEPQDADAPDRGLRTSTVPGADASPVGGSDSSIPDAHEPLDSATDASWSCSEPYHGDGNADGGPCVPGMVGFGAIGLCGSPIANAGRVTRDMRLSFRACYEHALETSPEAVGAMTLILFIGPSGAVTRVQGMRLPSLPLSVGDCVEVAARRGIFDSSATGAGLEVLLTFGCAAAEDAGSGADAR